MALVEDQWFDRKSIAIKARDLAKPLVALANAEGGTLVIGLHKGTVQGIDSHPRSVNELRQASIDFTRPPVRAYCSEVPCINVSSALDHLLVIRVEPGERVHETQDGECYLRVGDESRKLGFEQRQELEFDKGHTQFDGMPVSGVSTRALDLTLLQNYADKIGSTQQLTGILSARALLTLRNEMTNAAILLFGKNPSALFPQAHVRIIKYLANTRGTGSGLNIEEDKDIRIEDNLPMTITHAQAIIEKWVPLRRSLSAQGRFEPLPIVPRDAWLEGLVNAVIHRSYSNSGDHIRFEIFPDRIEIESPGRFPGLADPSRPLDISRFARNPRIARVCADLRIGQELGEGIKRIYAEMRKMGLTDPVYSQTESTVRLLLTTTPRLDARTAARLPRGSQQVLDLLRRSGALGTGDVVEAIHNTRPVVLRRLRALESEGLIRWVGKSPQDPRAVWEITD